MNPKNKSKPATAQIEAILLAAGEPVEISKLARFLKVSKGELEREVEELEKRYEKEGSGLQINSKGNKIQLVSKAELGNQVAEFLGKDLNEPLTRSLLETLAVVAYRGPITRAGVEHVRGVNCSFALRNLAMRGLLERQENPADNRSYLYSASHNLLNCLGLKKLEDLPDFDQLSKKEAITKDHE